MDSTVEPLTSHDIRNLVRPDHVHRRACTDAAIYMTSFYNKGVLVHDDGDSVAARDEAA